LPREEVSVLTRCDSSRASIGILTSGLALRWVDNRRREGKSNGGISGLMMCKDVDHYCHQQSWGRRYGSAVAAAGEKETSALRCAGCQVNETKKGVDESTKYVVAGIE
jgi:hypothetical protein